MYFSFGDEGGKYLVMLLLGLFALWWIFRKVLKLFGNVLGMWLYVSIVCVGIGMNGVSILFILGIVSLIACLVFLCGMDVQSHTQYYSNRTEQQRQEEEKYGIIDFTDKDE